MQREEKLLEDTLETIIQRIKDLKASLTTFLLKLEHEHETITWPNMLANYALISSQLNSLQKDLKSDKCPPLRNYVFLPLLLSPDRDPDLEKLTEGRVFAYDHDAAPNYLRTKPEPEVEEKMTQLNARLVQSTQDQIQKQISALSRASTNILDLIQTNREEWENDSNQRTSVPQTSSLSDTNTLIAAINFGKGLKPLVRRQDSVGMTGHPDNSRPQMSNPTSHPGHPVPQVPTPNINIKAPSMIKTNIKSAASMHPYSRP